ncbi:PAS domain S-box protein [candidate division KSB1 bacterium]|nr:PAS domain S-box protein [candidate division KSB1 bacterium]
MNDHKKTKTQLIAELQELREQQGGKASQKKEMQLRTTLESIGDGFFAVDEEWRFVYVNAQAEDILGIKRDEVLGKRHWDVFPLTLGTELERRYRLAANGQVQDWENFYEPWQRWFHNRCFPREGGGISVYFQEITKRKIIEEELNNSRKHLEELVEERTSELNAEITMRKQTEKQLQENEKNLHRAHQIANLGNWNWDVKSGTLIWSKEIYDIFGVEKDFELTYDSIVARIYPEDHHANQAFVNHLLDKGVTSEFEFRIIHSDGTIRYISQIAEVRKDDEGSIQQIFGIMQDITNRKESEERLRQSEAKYRTIVETASEGIVVAKPEGSYTFVNQQMADMLGFAIDEILGKSSTDFTYDGWKPEVVQARKELNKGQIIKGEFKFQRRDGSELWTFYNATPVFDDRGQHIANLAMHTDITERKRAEEKLRKSEIRYHRVLDSMLEGCQIIGHDWRYIYLNRAAATQGHRPVDELIGKTMLEAYPGIEATPLFETLRQSMQTREAIRFDNQFTYPDDSVGWFELSVQPIDEGLFILSSDITERKYAETKLSENEERIRLILETTSDGFWIVDSNRRFRDVNRAYLNMSGYTRKEILSMSVPDVEVVESPQDTDARIQRIIQQGFDRFESRHRRKDGSIFDVEISINLLSTEPLRLICFCRDITRRKLAERELQKSEARFQSIFENSPVAIAISRVSDQQIINLNAASINLFGFTPDEVAGQTTEALGIWKLPEDRRCFIELLQKQGYIRGLETTMLLKSGQELSVLLWGELVELNDELCMMAQFIDITERKQAEERLRINEEKYRGIFHNSVAAIYLFDENKHFIDSNQAGLDLLGYSREELMQLSIPEVDADPVVVLPAHAELLSGGRLFNYEHRLCRKDKTVITVLNNSMPLTDSNGQVIGMLSTLLDISDRKKAEDALRESEAKLSNALQIAKLAYWEYNVVENLFTFNDQFYALFRTSVEHTGGYKMSPMDLTETFLHPDDRWMVENEIKQALETSDPKFNHQIEHRIIYADGDIGTVSVRYYIMKNELGQTIKIYGTNQDITERKEAEKERATLEAQLQRGQKLETIGEPVNNFV